MFFFPPTKAPPTMSQRILRALKNERSPVEGRLDLMKCIFPDGRWTLKDVADMNTALISLTYVTGEVKETKHQLPGTGVNCRPVFVWRYALGVKK